MAKFIPFPISRFESGLRSEKSGIISLGEIPGNEILVRDPGGPGQDRDLTILSTLEGFQLYAAFRKGEWDVSVVDISTDLVTYRPKNGCSVNISSQHEILAADSLLYFLSSEIESVTLVPGHTVYVDSARFPTWHYLQGDKKITIIQHVGESSDAYRYFSIWFDDSMVQNFALFISSDSGVCIKNSDVIPTVSDYKSFLDFSHEGVVCDIFGNSLDLEILSRMFLQIPRVFVSK